MTEAAFYQILNGYIPKGSAPKDWAAYRPDRHRVSLCIYGEKDPDANPYYASNHILKQCISAVEAIIEQAGPCPCGEELVPLLEKIYIAMGLPPNKCSIAASGFLHNADEPFLKEFGYFISHHVITIDRIAGGHRGPIQNDTEIYISVCLLPGTAGRDYVDTVQRICRDYSVQCRPIA